MELIPSRASYRPDESVSIDLGVVEPGAVARVWSGLDVRSEHAVEPGQPLLSDLFLD